MKVCLCHLCNAASIAIRSLFSLLFARKKKAQLPQRLLTGDVFWAPNQLGSPSSLSPASRS